MKNEITIPKWAWITGVIVFLLVLGMAVSPHDKDDRPILLLPDVKAVEDYRRSLVSWHGRLLELDGRIARILSDDYGGDLFSQSSEGQKILNETIQVLQEMDQTETPPAAVPAREIALRAGTSYLDASRSMLAWISAPTPANLSVAQQVLDGARSTISDLEASQWMATNR
jgi:hypothetical protein